MSAMGLDDFITDVQSRRQDQGRPLFQFKELEKHKQIAENSKIPGLNAQDHADTLRDWFGGREGFDSREQLDEMRAHLLQRYKSAGQTVNDSIVLNLGEEHNNRKIVLSNSELLSEYVGMQIGGSGLTRHDRLLQELLKGIKDPSLTTENLDTGFDREKTL